MAQAKDAISAAGLRAQINPSVTNNEGIGTASPVEFDIAVTVASSSQDQVGSKKEGTIGGVLAVVGVKIGGSSDEREENTERNEAVSRVKFTVMLAQPADTRPMTRVKPTQNAW